jgi:hypothetical protein
MVTILGGRRRVVKGDGFALSMKGWAIARWVE